MITLRYKRSRLIFLSLCGLLGVIILFFYGFPAFRNLTHFGEPLLWILALLETMFLLALVVGIILICVAEWAYRIDFHDSFFETHTGHLPFRRRFQYVYEEIVSINQVSQGQITIVPRKGNFLRMDPNQYEGGQARVFDVLMQYISVGRFEPGLRNRFQRLDQILKILYPAFYITLGCMLVLTVIRPPRILPILLGWNYFDPLSAQNSIISTSIESPTSLWIARQEPFSKISIEHINGNQTQTWYLSDDGLSYSNLRVLANSHQEPVLVTAYSIYSLKDKQWQKQDYQINHSEFPFQINNLSILTNEYWGLTDNKNGESESLVHIRADAPHAQTVTLRNPTTQKPIEPEMLEVADDGTILLLENTTIYLLRNGKIQDQFYPFIEKDKLRIADFTKANDSVYVLFSDFFETKNFVEKIDANGKQTFTDLPDVCDQDETSESYKALNVDSRGRLWLEGFEDSIRVVEPVWGGTASTIVKYDQYNSNYKSLITNNSLYTKDGHIWAANDDLVWIDSNAVQLPEPLPDWLAYIRQDNTITLVVLTLWMGISMLIQIVSWRPSK